MNEISHQNIMVNCTMVSPFWNLILIFMLILVYKKHIEFRRGVKNMRDFDDFFPRIRTKIFIKCVNIKQIPVNPFLYSIYYVETDQTVVSQRRVLLYYLQRKTLSNVIIETPHPPKPTLYIGSNASRYSFLSAAVSSSEAGGLECLARCTQVTGPIRTGDARSTPTLLIPRETASCTFDLLIEIH